MAAISITSLRKEKLLSLDGNIFCKLKFIEANRNWKETKSKHATECLHQAVCLRVQISVAIINKRMSLHYPPEDGSLVFSLKHASYLLLLRLRSLTTVAGQPQAWSLSVLLSYSRELVNFSRYQGFHSTAEDENRTR